MTFVVAVAGKGGVGKTTFSALAVRHLHEKTGEVVLAVDADPNANLGAKLGTEAGRTLGSIREEIIAHGEEPPPGMAKQEFIDYQIRLALKEGDGFDLLTMGRQEGPGCYCYVNNILRTLVDSISERYEYVVIDNEAGMEHLSRRTTRASDVLFVVSDSSRAALESASRIASLAREMNLKIGRTALVKNMSAPGEDSAQQSDGFDAVYVVRNSASIRSGSLSTESLLDIPLHDPAYQDIQKAMDEERRSSKR